MRKLIVMSIFLFAALITNAQDAVKVKSSNGIKIGFGYGESYYTNSQSGTTFALDLTAPIGSNWQITGFGEKNKKPRGASDKHSHYGVVIGQKFTFFKRLELSYGIGVGHISRITTERHSVLTGETGFLGLPTYRNYTTIDQFSGYTVPLKFGLDFKVLDNISVGVFTRTTYHDRPVFGTVNASLGIHF